MLLYCRHKEITIESQNIHVLLPFLLIFVDDLFRHSKEQVLLSQKTAVLPCTRKIAV